MAKQFFAKHIVNQTPRTYINSDNEIESILDKFDATADPGINNDVDEGYVIGSLWINITLDKIFQCVDNSDGAAVWIRLNYSPKIISYSLAEISTFSQAWIKMHGFIFPGTDFLGLPTNCKVIYRTTTTIADIRVQDVSNTNTICSVTGVSNAVDTIVDLGTISNLPTGEALFELQGQTGSAPASLIVSALEFLF